jgi:iron-only hydrogenase group A
MLNIKVEVNNKKVQANKGETILDLLHRIGIQVPTICSMKDFAPTGACRMCVVEIEGREKLIPSCSFIVEEGMKIHTHSARVIKARKTIVELLLSNHPDDCLYCERNRNCELQKLAEELHVRERRIPGKKSDLKLDKSSPGITRDPEKCILCGRCVRICEEEQKVATLDFSNRGTKTYIATAFRKDLNFSSCINCGQCVVNCPTGALVERVQFSDLDQYLHNPGKIAVVHYSPTVAVTLAEEFGVKPGKEVNGLINGVLRKLGFTKVFDTSFAADFYIAEQAAELAERIKSGKNLPQFTSCCPGWVKYAEQFMPGYLPHFSTVKSPQQIMGTLIKKVFAREENMDPDEIFSVSVMPCTAKKHEAQRVELSNKGTNEIDAVLTTRELAKLVRMYGIDINTIESEPPDNPFGTRSSAGRIIGASGGTAEAIARSAHYFLTGKDTGNLKLSPLRGSKHWKETTLNIGKRKIGIAVLNGLKQVNRLKEELESGRKDIHLVEVMSCYGGCVSGGGQPLYTTELAKKARAKALFDGDEKDMLRLAHKNPLLQELYKSEIGEYLGKNAKKMLHTTYTPRIVLK